MKNGSNVYVIATSMPKEGRKCEYVLKKFQYIKLNLVIVKSPNVKVKLVT